MAGSSEFPLQGIPEESPFAINNNRYECGADYVLEEIPDGLKCPLCKKMFDTPLQLPCMHTFCLKFVKFFMCLLISTFHFEPFSNRLLGSLGMSVFPENLF